MQTFLFIAEKPSLMRDVETCYKKHKAEIQAKVGSIDFIALAGHVCRNFDPDEYDAWKGLKWGEVEYPMIPDPWKVAVAKDSRKAALVKEIKTKIKDYDGIIVGTDSDQEGYGIYYLLEHYIGAQKKYTLRFIEHSLTDNEILKSLLSMTDYHKDPSHIRYTKAFLMRSQADWLYGLNATRMVTNKCGQTMNIGRVKAPTIKLVYDNSLAIENFVVKNYFIMEADYGEFKGHMVEEGTKTPVRFDALDDCPEVDHEGRITVKEVERKKEHAPQLYDLPSIQIEAGRVHGYSPDKTLEILQELYEKERLISYPRTEVRVISSERALEFDDMLDKAAVFDDLKPLRQKITAERMDAVRKDKKIVNDAAIQREGISHDAILPTSKVAELSTLSKDEINLYYMICKRLVAQFMPQYEEDATSIIVRHGVYDFLVKGKIVVEAGWKALYVKSKDAVLPSLERNDDLVAEDISPVAKKTTPPKRLSQGSLLEAMQNIANTIEDPELKKSLAESKGIGTPATRAGIIREIIAGGFVDDKKEGLFITGLGRLYCETLVDNDIHIIWPVFAAELDMEIKRIQRGEAAYEEVYRNICDDLTAMCEEIEQIEFMQKPMETACPACGDILAEGRYYYECKECGWKLQRYVCGVTYEEDTLKALIEGKESKEFTFQKKDNSKFQACLKLKDDKSGVEFVFKNAAAGIKCPVCKQENVRINQHGAFCKCEKLKAFRNICKKELTDAQLTKLLTTGFCTNVGGLVSKKGTKFSANLKLNKETGMIELDGFVTRKGKPSRG